MPIYEFQCKKCGHRFERMQKMSDPHPSACPDCKARNTVEQLMSAPAAHFKGSGWYATDYAKKPAAAAGKPGDTKTDVKVEAGSEKKTETKTETKSETKTTTSSESKSDKK